MLVSLSLCYQVVAAVEHALFQLAMDSNAEFVSGVVRTKRGVGT